ncbi:cupin [Sphingomonas sp. TREG-RG-20F-R18-01]|uniref:1,2-dihydroxy-3-keto-5-methylthiopentene dioxygenase n=1 Tax=Sphingomonas sp. TREG-RG-20F-R18-01 TaxID=2914982 RepID=UPI001F583EB2|nr:cupin [Sphingomonas sp. TREG-RG-20F-R18-01]
MTTLTLYDLAEPHACLRETRDAAEIATLLAPLGIRFERWAASVALPEDASDDDVIRAYRRDIDRLMAEGGYRSCDVIRLLPDNPARATLRTKFLDEHTHAEDEVRFFVEGSGVFYIRGADAVYALECTRDDLIAVPEGTRHWFDMGPAPRFTAIRLFAEPDGWVASFTGDAIARGVPLYEGSA